MRLLRVPFSDEKDWKEKSDVTRILTVVALWRVHLILLLMEQQPHQWTILLINCHLRLLDSRDPPKCTSLVTLSTRRELYEPFLGAWRENVVVSHPVPLAGLHLPHVSVGVPGEGQPQPGVLGVVFQLKYFIKFPFPFTHHMLQILPAILSDVPFSGFWPKYILSDFSMRILHQNHRPSDRGDTNSLTLSSHREEGASYHSL